MNPILTIEMITLESLRVFTNALTFASLVNRQYDSMFAKTGAKIGDIAYVRKPPRYIVRIGSGAQRQATVQTRVPIKMDRQVGVDLPFSSVERTLSLDNYSDNVIKPAVSTIANQIDYDGLQLYKEVYNLVGTPGTAPASTVANGYYLGAGVKLDDMGAPQDDQRYLVVTPNMQASAVAANFSLFNPSAAISESFRKGRFGRGVLGFDWFMDQNCPTHTEGTRTGTNASSWTVSGSSQTGASLLISGLTSGDTLKKGDVFTLGTIAAANGCQSVNPQSRQATGSLQQFVVTADFLSDGGTDTIQIDPPITPSGQFQTVDQSPTSGAVLTFASASALVARYGLGFHKDAFTLVTAPLILPKGVHESYAAVDEDSGVSIRIVTFYDGDKDEMITRMDALYGWAALRPELACRIGG